MSNFLPNTGTLFYAESLMFCSIPAADRNGTATMVRTRERSYANNILRCVAIDSYIIVSDIVYGDDYMKTRRILRISDYKFHPVGPGVPAALGLEA